jgi:hypothetical protein
MTWTRIFNRGSYHEARKIFLNPYKWIGYSSNKLNNFSTQLDTLTNKYHVPASMTNFVKQEVISPISGALSTTDAAIKDFVQYAHINQLDKWVSSKLPEGESPFQVDMTDEELRKTKRLAQIPLPPTMVNPFAMQLITQDPERVEKV